MREGLLQWLRCPRCHTERRLVLEATGRDAREVREGRLRCRDCLATYEIADGIVDLLVDLPEFVRREIAGLARFAERMRDDGWTGDRIRALPEIEVG